jgi:hypothetical protein
MKSFDIKLLRGLVIAYLSQCDRRSKNFSHLVMITYAQGIYIFPLLLPLPSYPPSHPEAET